MSNHLLNSRKTKHIAVCLALLTFALIIQTVAATNQTPITCSVGTDGIFRAITKGEELPQITFHLSETTGAETQLMLYTDGFLEQNGGCSIDTALITINCAGQSVAQPYNLPAGGLVDVTLGIDTKTVNAGTYKGAIIVQPVNSSSLTIPVKIQVSESLLFPVALTFTGVFFGFLFVYFDITIPSSTTRTAYVFKMQTITENAGTVIAFIVLTAVVWATAFVAYYPKITAFGASPIDYFAAFLFGLAQVGAAKITVDILKRKT